MKRLKYLSKLVSAFLFLALVIGSANGCASIDVSEEQAFVDVSESQASVEISAPNLSHNYVITITNTSDYYVYSNNIDENMISPEFWFSSDLSFDLIEILFVGDYHNGSGEINEIIRDAATSWISGNVLSASSVSLYILCHSERYLSFCNSFEFVSNRIDHIRDFITIDMQTGERVMLNDLVEINEDFVNYIQTSNIAKDSRPVYQGHISAEWVWEMLNKYEVDELIAEFEECSYTQAQVIQNEHYSTDESLEALIMRNSFFVQDNTLVIVVNTGDTQYQITLDLDDIEDYLKVGKW